MLKKILMATVIAGMVVGCGSDRKTALNGEVVTLEANQSVMYMESDGVKITPAVVVECATPECPIVVIDNADVGTSVGAAAILSVTDLNTTDIGTSQASFTKTTTPVLDTTDIGGSF